MTLNVAKSYDFEPKVSGPVLLTARSSRRARLWIGGTYFRSKEIGASANQIKVGAFQSEDASEAIFVSQHTGFNPDEMVFGDLAGTLKLTSLNLEWNQVLRITRGETGFSAEVKSIRWQISGGESLVADLGPVPLNRIFVTPQATFTIMTDWSQGEVLELRPRTRRTTLVAPVTPDPVTGMVPQGFDLVSLRTAVNSDDSQFVYMPDRPVAASAPADGSPAPAPSTEHEDGQDTGEDDASGSFFDMTNLATGDGLPLAPVGLNTGPSRSLVLLNYGELPNGKLGELNQVYEWVGTSASEGSWQPY